MASRNPWLRLWVDFPTDPKFRSIAKAAKQSISVVMSVYLHVLVNASNSERRGELQNFCAEDVANALDIETVDVDAILKAMQGRVLAGDLVTGWEKRQPKREDNSTPRSAAHREKQSQQKTENTAHTATQIPQRERTATQKNARGEERREEKIGGERVRAPAPEAGQQSAAPHPPIFSEENRDFAKTERPDLDPDQTWANFCDHYPVEKQTDAVWRKWVRREVRVNLPDATTGPPALFHPDSKASIETLGCSVGIGKWDELKERWETYKARVIARTTTTESTT